MKIDTSFLEKYPGLQVQELLMFDLEVKSSSSELTAFKKQKQEEIRRRVQSLEFVRDLPIIRAYRDFYWKVGIDPTKTRPAGEALLRRILNGKDLPAVITLVDSYNIASAETMISIAAFDLAKISQDNLLMRKATKGEEFFGIGMESSISLNGIEVVIEDTSKRNLIAVYPYRDSKDSMVTKGTREVLFMMCGVPGITNDSLEVAFRATSDYVSRYCSGSSSK